MHQAIQAQAAAVLGATPRWRRLASRGTTNTLYQGRVAGQTWVLRVNAAPALAFGVVREREARTLARIAGYRWAPEVRVNAWRQGWCLMRHHGPALGQGRLPAGARAQLLAAVAAWQGIGDEPRFDYAALFAQYEALLVDAAPARRALLQSMLHGVRQTLAALPAVPGCLTHHDLHAGNLCWDGQRLVVLDWEYGGIGNPWFDAVALHRLAIPLARLNRLPAFRGLSVQRFQTGLRQAQWMTQGLEYLWYWCRGLQGSTLTEAELETRTRRWLAQWPSLGSP